MLLTGRDIDISWQPSWEAAPVRMGHGTRCTVSIEGETLDVLALDQASGTMWADKVVTGGTWGGDAEMLCTQSEADALVRQSLAQATGGELARIWVPVGGTQVTGRIVLDSVDASGDVDGMLEVSVSFTGTGFPAADGSTGDGVFDVTFDSTFE